jgi:hypothetical protein
VVITDAPLTLCGNCPLVSAYQNRGAISAKLACNGKIYGMITLSVPEAMLFDPEENRLAKNCQRTLPSDCMPSNWTKSAKIVKTP